MDFPAWMIESSSWIPGFHRAARWTRAPILVSLAKRMTELASLISRHGYIIVATIVFAESIGLPFLAALSLVTGGAAVAAHLLRAPILLPFALGAMLTGDTLLFFAGRRSGWRLLGFLCKVSANPETCILRSAESFYKRGKMTLLLAKFVPGDNTMAPPLAGSMKMRYEQFLWFDLAGAALYTLAYGTVGYVFRDFVASITHGFQTAQHVVEFVRSEERRVGKECRSRWREGECTR